MAAHADEGLPGVRGVAQNGERAVCSAGERAPAERVSGLQHGTAVGEVKGKGMCWQTTVMHLIPLGASDCRQHCLSSVVGSAAAGLSHNPTDTHRTQRVRLSK
jgi:hypothetical protein